MKFNKYWNAAIGLANAVLVIITMAIFIKIVGDEKNKTPSNIEAFLFFFIPSLETIILYFLTGLWAEKSLSKEENNLDIEQKKKKQYILKNKIIKNWWQLDSKYLIEESPYSHLLECK